jgi:DNA-binding SARP family transcriptional activator
LSLEFEGEHQEPWAGAGIQVYDICEVSPLEFRILGVFEVLDGGKSVSIGTPRSRTVLGVLLTRPNEVVSVDRLVDELWPDRPPSGARAQVHDYISKIRRSLRAGPGGRQAAARVVTRKPGYLIEVDHEELDSRRFEAQLRIARRSSSPDIALRHFSNAHQLWKGEPFAGIPRTEAIGVNTTVLVEQYLASLEERFAITVTRGADGDAISKLTGLVIRYPLRERLVALLMRALYGAGRTAEALDVGRRTRRQLVEELGVDPGPVLRETELAILRGDLEPAATSV